MGLCQYWHVGTLQPREKRGEAERGSLWSEECLSACTREDRHWVERKDDNRLNMVPVGLRIVSKPSVAPSSICA